MQSLHTEGPASPVLAALGVGLALASAPGPVQAVLLTEAVRGGTRRGLTALAGSSLTFGSMLLVLALGLSLAPPSDLAIRVLRVAGGLLLLWLAFDALRSGYEVDSRPRSDADRPSLRTVHPTVRGSLAVVLNPGAWLFLAAVASPLFASATRAGGRGNAVLAAAALAVGTSSGDVAVVLLGALGLRRAGDRVVRWIQRVLAALLAALGVWLLVQGVIGT
jgi:threonine/homoserine/homoserine lactone efflux protein